MESQWSGSHCAAVARASAQGRLPCLGERAVSQFTAPALLETLRRVEARGVRETVHSILQSCGQGFRYGIATGRCERNPASDLRGALKPVLVKNMAAVTDPCGRGDLMRSIEHYQGSPLNPGCVEAYSPAVSSAPAMSARPVCSASVEERTSMQLRPPASPDSRAGRRCV